MPAVASTVAQPSSSFIPYTPGQTAPVPQLPNTAPITSTPQQPGMIQSFVRGVVSPFMRLGSNVVNAGKEIAALPNTLKTGQLPSITPTNYGSYLGSATPVGQQGTFGQKLEDAVGTGLQVASYTAGGEGAADALPLTLKGAFLQAAKTGAISGGIAGAEQGAGTS